MKKLYTTLLTVIAGIAFSHAQSVTYNSDISCILYEHCTTCHHDGGIAPFSLMDYDDASAAAFGMLGAVNSGTMPPWPPNSEYNSLAHERLLSDDEIAAINDWVNNGYPEGLGTQPQAPVYSGIEQMTDPDLVLTMPEYTIATNGNDVYRCFVIPTSIGQDVYITEIEVVPGNYEAVHHVILYQDETNTPQQLDDADPGPGYTSFGGTGSSDSKTVGGWVPGQGVKVYPSGMGVRIPNGANIVMQVHYPVTANGQVDQTKVNIKYTTGWAREIYIDPPINHFDLNEGQLTIPADEIRTFTGDYTIPNEYDIIVLDVSPHMHLIGKSLKSWAVTASDDTIPFIDIPDWDFHWQGFYDFRQPIVLPGGTTFYGEATYDNTSNNPNNPSNPPQTVSLGESTTEEMMLVFFSYTLYFPGDENIVVDTSTIHENHFCASQVVGLDEQEEEKDLSLYPNPANNVVQINLPRSTNAVLTLTDMYGRLVREIDYRERFIDVSSLAEGVYMVSLKDGNRLLTKRLVVQH